MEPQQQSKKPCKPKVCRAFLVLAERTGLFLLSVKTRYKSMTYKKSPPKSST